MKKLIAAILLSVALLIPSMLFGEDKSEQLSSICPKTLMSRDCLTCHAIPGFKIKESAPDAQLVYPIDGMELVLDNGVPSGYYLLAKIDDNDIKSFFGYLTSHGIKNATIEIHSPGGALFNAQRIISYIRAWQSRGGIVTTKIYGMAFSAGFYIFSAGDVRLVDRFCVLMWHEIQTGGGFGFSSSSTSDKEDEARVLRQLQDNTHAYLATRGKISKDEIDKRVKKRQEWWMTGEEAIKYGFADGFIK